MYPEEAPYLIWITVSCYVSGLPGNRLDVAKCTPLSIKHFTCLFLKLKVRFKCHIWSNTKHGKIQLKRSATELAVGKTHEDKSDKK